MEVVERAWPSLHFLRLSKVFLSEAFLYQLGAGPLLIF